MKRSLVLCCCCAAMVLLVLLLGTGRQPEQSQPAVEVPNERGWPPYFGAMVNVAGILKADDPVASFELDPKHGDYVLVVTHLQIVGKDVNGKDAFAVRVYDDDKRLRVARLLNFATFESNTGFALKPNGKLVVRADWGMMKGCEYTLIGYLQRGTWPPSDQAEGTADERSKP